MAELISDDKPLPMFRNDLRMFEGPEEPDGSPTWNLYDPVKAKYFKLNWAEFMVLEKLKPGMTLDQLYTTIKEETTLGVTKEEIKYFFVDAFRQDLLAVMKPSEYFDKVAQHKSINPFIWLIFNYLYLRVPLLNPDPFLTKTIKYVRPLGSTIAFIIYGIISFIGIILLMTRFTEFISTFTYFFNVEGILVYAIAISCVKIVHEFSHAFTAKNFGLYIPTMGVALIVLWPVLYTDVTEGWKLKKRSHRILISSAGVMAELIIAGLSTIGWYFSSPGLMQSVFFVISSITWVSTLVINLNPAIRFDGYYILSDLWGIDNLQFRCFNVARWKFRDWLLGLKMPPPEENLTEHRTAGMVAYAVYTWIYRVILYTSIAIFVYFKFTKALGVFLFFLEIGVFLIWPILSELNTIKNLRSQLSLNPRLMATFTVLLLLLGWFILPLPHTLTFDGITVAANQQILYVPTDARVKEIFVKKNQELKKGEPIVLLESPSLQSMIGKLQAEKKLVNKEIDLLSYVDTNRAYIPEKAAELASNTEKLDALVELKSQLDIRADMNGLLNLWNSDLYPGIFVSKDQILGKIFGSEADVMAFIPELNLGMIKVGQNVRFRIPSTNEIFHGKIESINALKTEILLYPALASIYQGPLAVTEDPKNKSLRMVNTYYSAKIQLNKSDQPIKFGSVGFVEVDGPWRSKLFELLKSVMAIFWKESGV